jgi:hypothetical protein
MYFFSKTKVPRKNLRTKIKKTNTKKLKISKVELNEFLEECRYVA